MRFPERMKQLRKEKGLTQIQLSDELGVSNGTVAMWETGKREVGFSMLETLSDYFDKRVDYLLGLSDDDSSPNLTEEQMEQLGKWEIEDNFYDTVMRYLQLDEFGKEAVENLISTEFRRCSEQESLICKDDYKVSILVK